MGVGAVLPTAMDASRRATSELGATALRAGESSKARPPPESTPVVPGEGGAPALAAKVVPPPPKGLGGAQPAAQASTAALLARAFAHQHRAPPFALLDRAALRLRRIVLKRGEEPSSV